MDDPRVEELMQFIDDVDENGEATTVALIARRVSTYLEAITDLRSELAELHGSAESLEERASSLKQSVTEREALRGEITEMAQTAAVKATFAVTTGQSAALRQDAAEKRANLKQFEDDYAADSQRLKELMRALEARQHRIMEIREQISRRLNIVDALLQRAEIQWPAYFFEENDRIKKQNQARTQTHHRKPSRGGRRRIVRRRRAS